MKDRILIKFGPTPEAGSCTISPASGYALTTPYNIICSDFTIKDGYLLLKYSVFSHTEPDFEKGIVLYAIHFSTQPLAKTFCGNIQCVRKRLLNNAF